MLVQGARSRSGPINAGEEKAALPLMVSAHSDRYALRRGLPLTTSRVLLSLRVSGVHLTCHRRAAAGLNTTAFRNRTLLTAASVLKLRTEGFAAIVLLKLTLSTSWPLRWKRQKSFLTSTPSSYHILFVLKPADL